MSDSDQAAFEERVHSYLMRFRRLREEKNISLLKSEATEAKEYIRGIAHKYSFYYRIEGGFLAEQRRYVRQRSGGVCEWCHQEKADSVHHIIGRGPLRIYHFPDFLLDLCYECHLGRWHERNQKEYGTLIRRREDNAGAYA